MIDIDFSMVTIGDKVRVDASGDNGCHLWAEAATIEDAVVGLIDKFDEMQAALVAKLKQLHIIRMPGDNVTPTPMEIVS